MNIQDEMDRIFKMQKDNLDNERKFIQRCKNGVGEWEVLPNFETFDTRKEAQDFLNGERKTSEDEEIKFMWLNYYECPECENVWEDQWDCQVDDDCSECGCRHISPSNSTEIEEVAK